MPDRYCCPLADTPDASRTRPRWARPDKPELQVSLSDAFRHQPSAVLARALVLADPGSRGRTIQRLQRERGNAFVQRLVAASERQAQPERQDLSSRIEEASSLGTGLDPTARDRLKERLGTDVSGIRVHVDEQADALARSVDAFAFTTRRNMLFRSGAYLPDPERGFRLLAQEATHVIQQASGPVARTPLASGVSLSDPPDTYERAAETTADRLMQWSAGKTPETPPQLGHLKATTDAVGPSALQRCGVAPCDCPVVEKALAVQRETICDEETGQCSEVSEATGVGEEFTSAGTEAEDADGGIGEESVDVVAGPGEGLPLPRLKAPPVLNPSCPPYTQSELKASANSGGRFDPPTSIGPTVSQQALMWDFEQGKAEIRPNHITGLLKMIVDLGLNTATPSARVTLIEGHTDCVDSESKNSPIREGRAQAARSLFTELGALDENVGEARGATQGSVPGGNSPGEQRARNRSSVIEVSEIEPSPEPTPTPSPRHRVCPGSHEWKARMLSSIAVSGEVAGIGSFDLEILDLDCNRGQRFEFDGLGGDVGFPVSTGGTSDFEFFHTTPAVHFTDFEGTTLWNSGQAQLGFGVSIDIINGNNLHLLFESLNPLSPPVEEGEETGKGLGLLAFVGDLSRSGPEFATGSGSIPHDPAQAREPPEE